MKVAFYLNNDKLRNIDFSDVDSGNPGIGGTEYMIWLVSCYLEKRYDDMDICLIADCIDHMPSYMKCEIASGVNAALEKAVEIGADIFVTKGPYIDESFYTTAERFNIKIIMWTHNYETINHIKNIAACNNIKRHICVGREQYEKLRDTSVFNKAGYIYNTIQFGLYENTKNDKINHSVCFVGGINKVKGFDKLAKIWKEVVKRVPDAQLYVIGSAKIYNSNASVGKYGISDKKYEKKFIKYILDDEGNIMSNIHFMGAMGKQKKLDIMSKMQVGIVNPSGISETFCISAVEFEALGVPVVTLRGVAYPDTVEDGKTGFLFKNRREFIDDVVYLLENDKERNKMGEYARKWSKEKFDENKIIAQWYEVISDVYNDVPVNPDYICHNPWNMQKGLREFNRKLQEKITFLPSILWYEDIPHKAYRVIKKVRNVKHIK